jgi:hypothetical protein
VPVFTASAPQISHKYDSKPYRCELMIEYEATSIFDLGTFRRIARLAFSATVNDVAMDKKRSEYA